MRQSLIPITALLLAGQAHASVTLSTGGDIAIVSDSRLIGEIHAGSGGTLLIASPGAITINATQPQLSTVTYPAVLGTSVSGNLSYSNQTSGGSQSGYFSESLTDYQGNPLSAEFSRQGYGYAAVAYSEVGNLHARASTTSENSPTSVGGSSASASASFSDWFVITGGSGWDYAGVNALSSGTLSGGGMGSASSSFSLAYSAQSYCSWWSGCEPWQANQTVVDEYHYVSGRRTRYSQDDLSGEFAFAFDQPFQITASLSVNAANGGSADYFNTSTLLGFYLPDGAELRTLAGDLYAPVPEPEAWAMLLVGLGLLELRRRRA